MDQHERDLEYIRKMRLMDDDFMSKVFDGSPECTQLVLRIILQREDVHVVSVKTQYAVHSLEGHSVRLDILAKDDHDVLFNVEIQRADRGAGQKRARYYSGLLDSMALGKGVDYNTLPDTYVIFITEHDVLNEGKALYHVERMIDRQRSFNDGSHIIYVNGAYRDSTPIGQLMHDFSCTNADDMMNPLLQHRAKYFKETTEGVSSMCKMLEEMRDETAEKTAIATKLSIWASDIQKLMLKIKISAEDAAELLEIPDAYRETVLASLNEEALAQ